MIKMDCKVVFNAQKFKNKMGYRETRRSLDTLVGLIRDLHHYPSRVGVHNG